MFLYLLRFFREVSWVTKLFWFGCWAHIRYDILQLCRRRPKLYYSQQKSVFRKCARILLTLSASVDLSENLWTGQQLCAFKLGNWNKQEFFAQHTGYLSASLESHTYISDQSCEMCKINGKNRHVCWSGWLNTKSDPCRGSSSLVIGHFPWDLRLTLISYDGFYEFMEYSRFAISS